MSDETDLELRKVQGKLADLERRLERLEHQSLEARRHSWREKFRPKIWAFHQYQARDLDVPERKGAEKLPLDPPRIAIVTPSFNHARFIRHTIDSVLSQDYPNLDYIVQDARSQDGTVSLLRSYGDRLAWHSERDEGQADGINRGFGAVSGEIMAYLNSDDLLLPGTLAYVASTFRDFPDVDFIYGHRIFIDSDGKEVGRAVLPRHDSETLKFADYVPQETMFWRHSVWDRIGPFDISFRYAMDWDFILRAQAAGFRFKRMPRFMGCFRVHPEQKTSAWEDIGQKEQARIRKQHLGHLPEPHEIDAAIRWYLWRHVLYHRLYKLRLLTT